MNPRALGVVGLLVVIVSGCSSQAGVDATAASAASQIERSTALGDLARDYEQARAAKQWDSAVSYADKLQRQSPNGALPRSVQDTLSDTNLHAEMVHDHERLAKLWTYNVDASLSGDVEGALVTASIAADGNADGTDGAAPRLVLRNHPKFGHGVNLVLGDGSFDCAQKCTVSVQFDDQPARPFAATTSTQNPHALTIDDEKAIRDSLDRIRVLTVATRVDGKSRSLSFPVGGFDRVSLERKLQ